MKYLYCEVVGGRDDGQRFWADFEGPEFCRKRSMFGEDTKWSFVGPLHPNNGPRERTPWDTLEPWQGDDEPEVTYVTKFREPPRKRSNTITLAQPYGIETPLAVAYKKMREKLNAEVSTALHGDPPLHPPQPSADDARDDGLGD